MPEEVVVDEMDTPSLDEVNPPAPAPVEEPPAEGPPTEADQPPAEAVAEVVAETLAEAEPPEEEPPEEAEAGPSETDTRLDRIEKLLEEMALTAGAQSLDDSEVGQALAGIAPKAQKVKAAPRAEPAESSVPVRRDIKGAITKAMHDKALESPEGLGEVLQNLYDTGLMDAQENMMRGVTGIVEPLVAQKFIIKNLTDDLYREIPGLFKRRQQVGRVAKAIQVENPDLGPVEVFSHLRRELKENYSSWLEEDEGSQAPAVKKKKVAPAIPMGPKKRAAVPAGLTGLQKDMQDMASAGAPDFG